jgi:hypothetical protein
MNMRHLLGVATLVAVQVAGAADGPRSIDVQYQPGPPPGPFGAHPAYKHAQADLAFARNEVARRRPEDPQIANDQQIIVEEISGALGDLHRADLYDGKDEPLPPPDVREVPEGGLHAAVVLLRRAESDVGRQEDNPRAFQDQQRALGHIRAALHASDDAIRRIGHD